MKKIVLFALMLLPYMAYSTHELGGQISATDLGSSSYQVKIKLWVDSSSAVINNLVYQKQVSGTVTNESATLDNNQYIGNGIAELTYLDTLGLNAMASYKLVYSICCRNGAISNVTSPSMQDFCISTTINNNPSITNSTPEFMNTPDFLSSPNDTLSHNPLAVDPDGDSLVFTWMNPLGANTTPLPMTMIPYPSSGIPFTVDAVTGEINWIPAMTGTYVYAVKVEEYRNGTLLSTAMRDAEVTICVGCKTTMSTTFQFYNTNTWPIVGGYYTFQAYPWTAFNYTFSGGLSTPNSSTLHMRVIGDASFMPNSATSNTATFSATQTANTISGDYSWTPTPAQIRPRPYLNVIVAKETNQSNQNSQKEKTFLVKVNAIPTATATINPEDRIRLFPNPSTGVFNLEIDNRNSDFQTLDIINITGQIIYTKKLQSQSIEAMTMETTNWPSGQYVVKLNGRQTSIKYISVAR